MDFKSISRGSWRCWCCQLLPENASTILFQRCILLLIIYYPILTTISKEIHLHVSYFMLHSNEDWMGPKQYVTASIKVYISVYRRSGLEIKKTSNWTRLSKNCKTTHIVWKTTSKCSCQDLAFKWSFHFWGMYSSHKILFFTMLI